MQHNPSSGSLSTYECLECGTRVEAETACACPDCSSEVRNVGVVVE
jgi:ABC-type ATPase with predicted acetyltransferase domain